MYVREFFPDKIQPVTATTDYDHAVMCYDALLIVNGLALLEQTHWIDGSMTDGPISHWPS